MNNRSLPEYLTVPVEKSRISFIEIIEMHYRGTSMEILRKKQPCSQHITQSLWFHCPCSSVLSPEFGPVWAKFDLLELFCSSSHGASAEKPDF